MPDYSWYLEVMQVQKQKVICTKAPSERVDIVDEIGRSIEEELAWILGRANTGLWWFCDDEKGRQNNDRIRFNMAANERIMWRLQSQYLSESAFLASRFD